MHGLVSLLPAPYYEEVKLIWKELRETYGLRGIEITPFPHFSWQIAENYDFTELGFIMQEVCTRTAPIKVRTSGLGIFTGPKPVIFIPVIKNNSLTKVHKDIWNLALDYSTGLSNLYHPDLWMPHISLAYEDVDPRIVGQITGALADKDLIWEMNIDNLALIYEPTGNIGKLMYEYKFRDQEDTIP